MAVYEHRALYVLASVAMCRLMRIDPCVLEHRALWQAARLCARASRSSKSSSCPHAHLVGLNMPLPILTHDHDDDDHDNDDDGDDGDHDDDDDKIKFSLLHHNRLLKTFPFL